MKHGVRSIGLLVIAAAAACASPQDQELPAPSKDAHYEIGLGDDTGGSVSETLADTGAALDSSVDFDSSSSVDTGVDAYDASTTCSYPSTESRPCGKCGTMTRSCDPSGTWQGFGSCVGEKIGASYCSVGESRSNPCGKCGTETDTCDPTSCTWLVGTCSGEGVCKSGDVDTTTASCSSSGEVRTRTCGTACTWGAYSGCALPKGWLKMSAAPTTLSGRYQHSAVWTGTDMIVWGGYGTYVSGYVRNDGASYRFASDTWKMLSAPPAALSTGRYQHSAVWSGNAMIVWGGYDASSTYHADGASYDPSTDGWKTLGTTTLAGRYGHGAVWSSTTNTMLVWGGYGSACPSGTYYCDDGAEYDPVTNTWTPLPRSPLAGRYKHSMVWTGTEMVVWGGYGSASGTVQYLRDGARYDPKTKIWVKFPDPPADLEGRWDHVSVFSGTELLVYGGYGTYVSPTYGKNTGARYLPGGSWTMFTAGDDTTFGTTAKRFAMAAWFGGGKLWAWSGANGNSSSGTALAGGAWYDPSTDTWGAMDVAAAPTPRARASVAWTGKEAIIWGGSSNAGGSIYYNDGAIYRP